jgi:Ca2+-binding RTX toxin-like protein
MRRTAATIVLAFGVVLLVAGTAFAVNRMCPDNCRGTADDDRLVGSSRSNTIYAEDGNDRVLGRGGEDALKGGDGRDDVYGQEGNDRVKGSAGMDEVYGGPGDDLVRGAPWSGRTTGRATSSTAAKARTWPTSWRARTPQ